MRFSRAMTLTAALAAAGCATTYEAKWDEKPTAAPPAAEAVATASSEGDAAWEQRGDKARLIEAITKWEAAFEKAPSTDIANKLARAHYLLGDGYYVLENNAEGRDAEYQKGLDWATRSLKLSAPEFTKAMADGKKHPEAIVLAPKDAVPAMYWYATNLGKWAATKGFATRLRYKDDIKATMTHVKSLDEMYFYAAPWRYFGSFEAVTAGLAGGSLEKSEENFKKAVELAPNYLGTKVLWADYLCTKKQDKATFKKLLEEVIAADAKIDPAIEPENRIEQAKAKKLLAEIDEKF
ncbi:MAG: TRAP transporter TatT component family protein [Archangium sp.]|nr:TRAP transporter TatT component family protein [Archangium sp.]